MAGRDRGHRPLRMPCFPFRRALVPEVCLIFFLLSVRSIGLPPADELLLLRLSYGLKDNPARRIGIEDLLSLLLVLGL